jgi:hypothetical protein
MKIRVSSVFSCTLDDVVREVRTPRLLSYVTGALMRFVPEDPAVLPETWSEGEYKVKMYIFRFVPFGSQYIVIMDEKWDGREFRIRDNGRGDFIRVWDHQITARRMDDGRVLYSDEITIEAGVMTPLIALYAAIFYRYRQYRWRKLIRSGFNYGDL